MRQLTAAVAIAAAGIVVAACGGSNGGSTASSSTTTTTTTTTKPPPAPITPTALASLLLLPADLDAMLGLTGTRADKTVDALQDDQANPGFPKGYAFPPECLFAVTAADVPTYASSGNTAAHGERDLGPQPPGTTDPAPEINQYVVLFPTADQANAFFTTSAQRWPACANRQDTAAGTGDNPDVQWKIGPVINANGVLSTTTTQIETKNGQTQSTENCQRALTVRNNVAIDIDACRKDPGDIGINIANQIAGKVDKQ